MLSLHGSYTPLEKVQFLTFPHFYSALKSFQKTHERDGSEQKRLLLLNKLALPRLFHLNLNPELDIHPLAIVQKLIHRLEAKSYCQGTFKTR